MSLPAMPLGTSVENLRRVMLRSAREYAAAFAAFSEPHIDHERPDRECRLAFTERQLEVDAHRWALAHKGDVK